LRVDPSFFIKGVSTSRNTNNPCRKKDGAESVQEVGYRSTKNYNGSYDELAAIVKWKPVF
jgi:hypothetical protein